MKSLERLCSCPTQNSVYQARHCSTFLIGCLNFLGRLYAGTWTLFEILEIGIPTCNVEHHEQVLDMSRYDEEAWQDQFVYPE